MASRTQIVCLCEGVKSSTDAVFINRLMRSLKPKWVRRHGNNFVRIMPCGGRKALIKKMPGELRNSLDAGADRTLMVWADCDDDCADGDSLKRKFLTEAQQHGMSGDDFDRVVFIFAKDRLENWIEFLRTGATDESKGGRRVNNSREAAERAKELADLCKAGNPVDGMPPSLQWSCRNWRALVERMT